MIDIVGYVASALLVAGMAMHTELKIKVVCVCAQVLWVVYGITLGLMPIIVLNVVLIAVETKDIFLILRRKRREC